MTTWLRRWRPWCIAACLTACLAHIGSAADAERTGEIQFSDGEMLRGSVSLTAGTTLRIYTGNALHEASIDEVREIRLEPEKESLERKWRFVEAGRTEKKFWGEPYPVRHLRATVLLANGQTMSGHLYTTVVYVENDAGTRKVVLRTKLRGSQGQGFDDLCHAVRVAFDGEPPDVPGDIRFALPGTQDKGTAEVVALTHQSLLRLAAHSGDRPCEFVVPSARGSGVFVGVKRDDGMQVAWPESQDAELAQSVRVVQKDVKDFFDVREILGVYRQKEEIYSLMMLRREGQTTLGVVKSQPWRLGIWRWKQADDGKLMLAGRGYFFRGIVPKGERPPSVERSSELWQLTAAASAAGRQEP